MIPNREQIMTLLTWIGKLLGIAGLFYIVYTLSQEYTLETFLEKFTIVDSIIPFLLILNIFSIIAGGILVWYMILRHYSPCSFSYLLAYYHFSKTEIAKYLPGNIFHLIGRQAIASQIGITQKKMAKTSLLSTLLMLAGTLFASTVFILFSPLVPQYIVWIALLVSSITMIVMYTMYSQFTLWQKLKMALYLTLSISLHGMMLALIIYYQIPTLPWDTLFLVCAIYILSWVIGFVTPGASGGLGVREGAFIAIMEFVHLSIDIDVILFSILLIRLINILVDMILFVSTFMLKSKLDSLTKA